MTASVYVHNFAVKFQRPELEDVFSFLSEAKHVIALFLFFGRIELSALTMFLFLASVAKQFHQPVTLPFHPL